mmetsp:Transcript_1443/g.2029  ORF Transcript_1443/g.2029 Transcript_1443/m.2029 type:complete len:377 (+) Transcript_1443:328-1458(+)
MFMPFCDNFWQAQASVMITPRLPLYIVEMYATIIYLSSTAARQFNLPYLSEATLTGLLAHVLYGVYDINGPPFLWWTWHDGDPAISQRQQNAPLGSSMWILTYISIHQLLLRFCEFPPCDSGVSHILRNVLKRLPSRYSKLVPNQKLSWIIDLLERLQLLMNRSPWAVRIAFSGLVCTPMFMSLMGVFQILSLDKIGVPGRRTYFLTLLVYMVITANGFRRASASGALQLPKLKNTAKWNKLLLVVTLVFYAVNFGIAKYGDSTTHVSTGCHQRFNSKSKIVKDVMGFDREEYIGKEGPTGFSKNDYNIPKVNGQRDSAGRRIVEPSDLSPEWYTVLGKRRRDYSGDIKLLSFMATIGAIGYGGAFSNYFSRKSYI